MRRSMQALLWAVPLCFFASFAAEARSLKTGNSQYCIGVNHASEVAGANIKQFRCDNRANQGWSQEDKGSGYFRLRNNASSLCMGVNEASKKPGANLKQFECDNNANQQWKFDRCPDGSGQCLVNKKSGLCATADPVAHDVQLEQEECTGGPAQVWQDLDR
ncbi:RICIN domain-containing protein [Pyxidicoccus trucidator]|uniref:RICIN domain-containing protein n=1 Tax=Pyxidicoccus trucidator TaxID=2709662 RepID=UPI0013DCD116|nr:RICIN domain-containing protein [Pyxidicoccus trucidator]